MAVGDVNHATDVVYYLKAVAPAPVGIAVSEAEASVTSGWNASLAGVVAVPAAVADGMYYVGLGASND